MSARRRLATVLIMLATLSGVAAIVTLWAAVQVFDTNEWTETSERILESEEVRTAIADYLVDELDAEGVLSAAGVTSEQVRQEVAHELGSDAAIAAWAGANRITHSTLLALVDERRSTDTIGDGGVRLDLGALGAGIAAQLGIPDPGFGTGEVSFQVIPTDRVDEIQAAVDTARTVQVVLLGATLVLYALALLLGAERRRIGFRVGVSLLVIALAGFAVRLAGPLVIEVAISPPPEAGDALGAVWGAGTSLLVWLASLAGLAGAFLTISTFAWGRVGGREGLRSLRRSEPA